MERRALRSDRIPFQARTKESILETMARVLEFGLDTSLRRIIVEVESGQIRTERYSTVTDAGTSPYAFARQKDMEEYVLEGENPYEELFKVFDIVRKAEWHVTHILCGSDQFHNWVRLPKRANTVFNAPILISSEVPKDVFLVCGCEDREGTIEDVTFSVKVTLPYPRKD